MSLIELPDKPNEKIDPLTGAIPYGLLAKRKHPTYHADFWARARAFYKGGVHLLEDEKMMNRVFPKHVKENDQVYGMRKKLAHYTNHSGAIVNHLLGKLFTDPIRLQAKPEEDDFYKEFQKDCSPPEGKEVSLNDLVGKVLLSAAQCQIGYALVEMPSNHKEEFASQAEQEKAGALGAWCVEVAPESVLDWELDKAGEYKWALLGFVDRHRPTVFEDRNTITENYWLYTPEGFMHWKIEYREGEEPKDDKIYTPEAAGEHTFGKVPLARLCLPDGLWIMSKLESLAREYFNKRNALSWAEFKALMPVLYEFIDPGVMPNLSGPGGDEGRATNQTRSPAHVQQRQAAPGQGDKAEWIAPPDAPFSHALDSCNSIRDEMHRVVQQMALSADTKGAMLRRSGDSKKQDAVALDVVLGEYGKLARQFVIHLLQLVERGRNDKPREWTASGLSEFDSMSSDALIEEEVMLDTVEIPSPTFKAERKKIVVRKVLGDSVSEEKLAEIDEQIEAFYSFESELAEAEVENARKQAEDDFDEETDLEDDDFGDGSSPTGAPRPNRVIATSGTRRRQF